MPAGGRDEPAAPRLRPGSARRALTAKPSVTHWCSLRPMAELAKLIGRNHITSAKPASPPIGRSP